MRNEHSCCGWNNSNRYDVFDMQKKTKRRKNEIQFFCILSLSPFHIHLTFGSCYQYSLTAWLVDKNISFLFINLYSSLFCLSSCPSRFQFKYKINTIQSSVIFSQFISELFLHVRSKNQFTDWTSTSSIERRERGNNHWRQRRLFGWRFMQQVN